MTRIRLGFGEWAFLVAVCWETRLTYALVFAGVMACMSLLYDWIESEQQR